MSPLMVWQALLFAVVGGARPSIISPPQNMTVGIGHPPLTVACWIDGTNLYWVINDDPVDSNNIAQLRGMGILVRNSERDGDLLSAEVTVTISKATNNTKIVCEAQNGSVIVSSNPATVVVADAPQSPSPEFLIVNRTTIQVEWEAPFTWDDFPITNYTVVAINQTSQEQLASAVLSPDMLSYSLTKTAEPCTNITFSVWANNSVGESHQPGIVHGAFPTRPGIFLNSPRSEVIFSRDNLPILIINFTFPSLCFYHNATYHVVIVDEDGIPVHVLSPKVRHWRESDSQVIVELREVGLQLNTAYMANISVSTIAGQSFVSFTFDTNSRMTSTENTNSHMTSTENINSHMTSTEGNVISIASACIATALVIAILASIAVCCVYVYRRGVKRKRECRNTNELSSRVHSTPMVQNPIYEGGVIYEEIPDVRAKQKNLSTENGEEVNHVPTGDIDVTSSGMCDIGKGEQEDVYTVMNSIGPLIRHYGDAAEAAAFGDEQVTGERRRGGTSKNEMEERYTVLPA